MIDNETFLILVLRLHDQQVDTKNADCFNIIQLQISHSPGISGLLDATSAWKVFAACWTQLFNIRLRTARGVRSRDTLDG